MMSYQPRAAGWMSWLPLERKFVATTGARVESGRWRGRQPLSECMYCTFNVSCGGGGESEWPRWIVERVLERSSEITVLHCTTESTRALLLLVTDT